MNGTGLKHVQAFGTVASDHRMVLLAYHELDYVVASQLHSEVEHHVAGVCQIACQTHR